MTAEKTPVKILGNVKSLVVSPESPESYDFSVSSDASSVSSDEITPFHREVASISDHKLDELAGRHAVEPLLKENPNRFVLFPIEDNEVSSQPSVATQLFLLSFIRSIAHYSHHNFAISYAIPYPADMANV